MRSDARKKLAQADADMDALEAAMELDRSIRAGWEAEDGLRAAKAEALREAAGDVDLSGYYPTWRTSCHLAENAMRDWLRGRADRDRGRA